MPTTNVLTKSRHVKLVKDIRQLIEKGRVNAVRAAQQELVVTYWKVGERILQERLTENAGYGAAILEDLSDELGIDVSTLKRCVYFFQTYDHAPSGSNLSWSHFKMLLSLRDNDERKWYEDLAQEEQLTSQQLHKAIKNDRFEQSKRSQKKTIVLEKLKRPSQATYVYKAYVKNVVDGDTLLLSIDLGFQVHKEQRVRLAEIDTPAMDEPKGQEAYRYVRDQLAKVDYVMVKTNKIDIYGRYVGHIFYSLKTKDKAKIFSQGEYLNQELLDQGLAQVL